MIVGLLLIVPLVAAGLAALPRAPRRGILVAAAAGHAGLVGTAWADRAAWHSPAPGWLALDEAGLLFLSITSLLFLAAAVYAAGYVRREQVAPKRDIDDGWAFANAPEAVFVACLLVFLAMMTLAALSRHLGLLWVAVEATTLASAPLIYFHRHHRSLEATWKYLVICSVGIALALLGNFFLAVAARTGAGGAAISLDAAALASGAATLDPNWLKGAFVLLLVGYGTKMGLAPLHTWLPDAHSEAPSAVSALLSGALLNCAFLALLRVHAVLAAAGLGRFSGELFVLFGLFSMLLAAMFLLSQGDYKRLLAYSSVEHMGILALGAGVGGLAGFGALWHAVNHSLAKAMLFLAAGNILFCYRSKSAAAAQGLFARLPATAVVWLAGLLAITGSPPFAPFLSEWTILAGMLERGQVLLAAGYLAALSIAMVGMATVMLRMLYAPPTAEAAGPLAREPLWSVVPPAALCLCVLVLGVWLPPPLAAVLHQAAAVVGVNQ